MKNQILTILTLISILMASASVKAQETIEEPPEPIRITTTIGQITDVVKTIGGNRVIVDGLMGAGVDPHLYKASASDVRKLAEAKIIFYNGLNLEAKLADVLTRMGKGAVTAPVGESVPKELLLDSVQYKGHYDPHIWFDVTLWMRVTERIRDVLAEFDPDYKDQYFSNTDNYIKKLKELDTYVQERSKELTESQRILVTAHDAFRYFGKRYNFNVVGLQGISTESQAGTADVKNLADFITERKIRAIFIESSVPVKNIRAVQEAVKSRGWDVEIGGELFSDAMGDKGTFEGTYIGMVTHNINIIVDALLPQGENTQNKTINHENQKSHWWGSDF